MYLLIVSQYEIQSYNAQHPVTKCVKITTAKFVNLQTALARTGGEDVANRPNDPANYYDTAAPELWRPILGDDLHFHFGVHDGADFDEALGNAVRWHFQHVPSGLHLLDAGCGWGGPAGLFTREHGATVSGITVSRVQQAFCQAQGMAVRIADLETDPLRGPYDAILCMESLEHLNDKDAFLRRCRQVSKRLCITISCFDEAQLKAYRRTPRKNAFGEYLMYGETLALCTPARLNALLEDTGWQIEYTRERRALSLPTLWEWGKRLATTYPPGIPTPQPLETLRNHVEGAKKDARQFVRNFPLIDIFAVSN